MSSYVFIDMRVQDWKQLLTGLASDAQVVLLDPVRDGITQIAQALEGVTDLDAIHIISHGSEGALYVGDSVLISDNLDYYSSELEIIGAALSSTGDILLYGCEVANGVTGRSFVDDLALYTGADVAASTDLTGTTVVGGDWVLEHSTGTIESTATLNVEALADYSYTLATVTGTGIAATIFTPTSVSGDYRIDALMSGYKWGSGVGTGATITYSFPTAGSVWANPYSSANEPGNNLGYFTEAERAVAREAISQWASVSNITFIEVADTPAEVGDIRFARSSSVGGFSAYASYPSGIAPITGDIWVSPSYDLLAAHGLQTLLHEIGHTLGLKHPFEDGNVLPLAEDNRGSTVMSYTQGGHPVATSPQSYDVLAIQYLYGSKGYTGGPYNIQVQVYGGESGDVIVSANGDDNLIGGGGDDSISGNDGSDTVWGGDGNDTIVAGAGNDSIYSGAGNNVLDGGAGADTIDGEAGNDSLSGGAGDDYLYGGAGVNRADYSTATSAVAVNLSTYVAQNTGGAGIDLLYAIQVLLGSQFNDTLTGDYWTNNVLNGAAGNDTLDGGGGADTAAGGIGDDVYQVDSINDVVIENAGEGVDTVNVQADVATYTLGANIENGSVGGFVNAGIVGNTLSNVIFESGATTAGNNTFNGSTGNDTMSYKFASGAVIVSLALQGTAQNTVSEGSDTLIGFENLTGSDFGDTLTGNSAANTIKGEGGNDTLNGGMEVDVLEGGTGNDLFYVDNVSDVVTEALNAGMDAVQSSASSFTLGANVEILVLTGVGNINSTGNTLNNTLTGNSGANRLDGGAGIDTLAGGAGDDLYLVNLSIDIVNENAAAGTDTVQSSTTHTLRVNVEHLILTGSGNAAGTGNGLDNTLTGNSGNNSLHGSTGADTASYANATGGVTANLSVAGAQNTVNMGSDTLIAIENLLGGNFNDTLTGNAGANRLDGGAGIDTLAGGAGDDLYLVNLSTDIVNENAAAGTDTVQSSTTHTLRVNVEYLILTGSGNAAGTGNGLDNTLTGNSGNNSLHGSTGADTASYANATGGVTANLSVAGAQNTVNMGSDTLIAIENLLGGNFNDTLTGNAGANRLDGGAGIDTLAGGAGDDLYLVNLSTDIVNENAAAGTDTVQSSTTHTLRVNVEHLILTGSGNAAGTGNGLDNTLTGNSGNNSLHGSTGADTASYANATGGVTANLSVAGAQNTVNMGSDTLIAIENLLGGNFNDTLTGNAGANTLRGGAGADALNGGGSSDIFDYNALTDAGDIITGFVAGAGGDKLDIDTLLSALGYAGVDPFADGYVRVLQSGLDSLLQIDSNGATAGANFATTLATLLNVTATNVTLVDNFIV